METKLLITMTNGAQFTVKSTLSFKEAVEDLIQESSALCQINETIVLNAFHIAFIEDITNDKSKGISIKVGGGGQACS